MTQLLHRIGALVRPPIMQKRIFDGTCRFISSESGSKDLSTPLEKKETKKFTTSEAYLNYKATNNFYGGDERDLPNSHNLVLTITGVAAFYYLIFLRDDIDADGGKELFKPLHETVPSLAIPLVQSAIAENRKFGYNTEKLEKKLAELMKEPDKHGGGARKLIEN